MYEYQKLAQELVEVKKQLQQALGESTSPQPKDISSSEKGDASSVPESDERLQQAEKEAAALITERDKLKSLLKEREMKVQELQRANADLETKRKELDESCKDLERDKQDLQQRYDRAIEQHKSGDRTGEAEVTELKALNQQYQARLKDLEERNSQLQADQERLDDLRRRNSELQQKQ